MSRPVAVFHIPVIPGTLVLVADKDRDGSPGGFPPEHAGEDLGLVRLLPGGGVAALSGFAPVKVLLDILRGKGKS